MPFLHNGRRAKVSFGLANNIAATALVGIGFLRATNSIIHLSSAEPELTLQALNLNLPVTFDPPSVRDPPTQIESPAIYMTSKELYDEMVEGEHSGHESK